MSKFTFIDLFAGIGGFHAALSAFGGECVYAAEIDKFAASIYKKNWGLDPLADITKDATEDSVKVPPHDVLAAGFPCQPFSKAGAQLGMDETRGTVYWNILRIIQEHHPKFVLLENVPNLTGKKHIHEWNVIIQTLRDEGYRVSFEETILSPHMIPLNLGGRPQNRNRIFITATYVGDRSDLLETDRLIPKGSSFNGWNPASWNIATDLPLDDESDSTAEYRLDDDEIHWIDAWDEFITGMREASADLPSWWPIWADEWVEIGDLIIPDGTSERKAKDLRRNAQMYTDHKKFLDSWTLKWSVYDDDIFPKSRRKIEWQAQDSDIWDTIIHFRPSGLRPKTFNYVPTLVASAHTSIIGPRKRRVTVRESARLQGFPDWFDFDDQAKTRSYKQLGNSVNIGAVWFIVKQHFKKDEFIFESSAPKLLDAVKNSPDSPDEILKENKWI